MRHKDAEIKIIDTNLTLKSGAKPGILIYYYPRLLKPDVPFIFLANGFSANAKTWTFEPLIGDGSFGLSLAAYLARQGFVVVVKNVGSERAVLEPTFEHHCGHVPQYAEAVIKQVPPVVREVTALNIRKPDGVHWVGHSLGGMEVMAAEDRSWIKSLITIAAPTFMESQEIYTKLIAVFLARIIGLHRRQINLALPIEWFGKEAHKVFDLIGIRSGQKLSREQKFLITLLLHLPGFRLAAYNFLNLEHLDRETSTAFFRTALSDETAYILVEFAQAVLKGRAGNDFVVGRKIVPLRIPTLVIAGGGDRIAPPHSCENLLQFVEHPRKEAVIFDEYDHLGLLVRASALNEVWHIITSFILEANISLHATLSEIRAVSRKLQSIIDDDQIGETARQFAKRILHRLHI
ncbi:MAG: alpha/beta fold hydrolase [bacterium]